MSDLISRQAAIDAVYERIRQIGYEHNQLVLSIRQAIRDLPSAQQEPEEFEWCTDCKEYDQERHCCHRWTKVIRQTVDELKQQTIDAVPVSWLKEYVNKMYKENQIFVAYPIEEMLKAWEEDERQVH